jgi:hypothetical protein
VYVTGIPKHEGLVGVEMLTLAGIDPLTAMVTGEEVLGLPLTHVALEVSVQVTTSPFAGVWVYVGQFVPTLAPFTFHWYTGAVPPLIEVPVNVTEVPGQTGFAEGEIQMPAGVLVLSDMVIALDFAGFMVAQERLEDIWQ